MTTSFTFPDTDVRISNFTPPENGTYIVDCGMGSIWFSGVNWLRVALSNTSHSTTPSPMSYQQKQVLYNHGSSFHREQIHVRFEVELTTSSTYHFCLAVKKFSSSGATIYLGNTSSGTGNPDAYIYVMGPFSHSVHDDGSGEEEEGGGGKG